VVDYVAQAKVGVDRQEGIVEIRGGDDQVIFAGGHADFQFKMMEELPFAIEDVMATDIKLMCFEITKANSLMRQ
jgi:hypothetical protein